MRQVVRAAVQISRSGTCCALLRYHASCNPVTGRLACDCTVGCTDTSQVERLRASVEGDGMVPLQLHLDTANAFDRDAIALKLPAASLLSSSAEGAPNFAGLVGYLPRQELQVPVAP